jgi:hypothetical protein
MDEFMTALDHALPRGTQISALVAGACYQRMRRHFPRFFAFAA